MEKMDGLSISERSPLWLSIFSYVDRSFLFSWIIFIDNPVGIETRGTDLVGLCPVSASVCCLEIFTIRRPISRVEEKLLSTFLHRPTHSSWIEKPLGSLKTKIITANYYKLVSILCFFLNERKKLKSMIESQIMVDIIQIENEHTVHGLRLLMCLFWF